MILDDEVKQHLVDRWYFAMKRSYNCAEQDLESNYWFYQGQAQSIAEILITIFGAPKPELSEPTLKGLKEHVLELRRKYQSKWKQESVVVSLYKEDGNG